MSKDNIDIKNLANFLISKILLVILSGVITGGIGFLYLIYSPPEYIATLQFSELSTINKNALTINKTRMEMDDVKKQVQDLFTFDSKDREMSDILSLSLPEKFGENIDISDHQKLALAFTENLKKIENIELALKNSDISYSELDKIAKKTNVRFLRKKNQYVLNYEYSFRNIDKIKTIKFIEEIFNIANSQTVDLIKKTIENDLEYLKITSEDYIKNLELTIATERDAVHAAIDDRIVFLSEQARMARALNIDTPLDVTRIENNNDQSESRILIEGQNKPYLEGYIALETEIQILKDRVSIERFTESIRQLERKISEVRQFIDRDKLVENSIKTLDNSIFVVTTNIYTMDVNKTKSRTYILLLSIFIGAVMSSIALLYYKIYFRD